MLLVGALGVAYEAATGVRWQWAAPIWLAAGAGIGFIVALFREIGRNTITSLSSLGKHRGYAVLGAAPELTPSALRGVAPDQRTPVGALAYMPASPFATAFRDLQGALAELRSVSFIAPLAGVGATTIALCAAVSATQQGRSVVVVDCDLRRRSLTKGFGVEPELGVLEVCEQPDYWRQYIEMEAETGLHFLPAARPLSPWKSLVGAPGFPVLIEQLKAAYDLVVLDCPPALSSAEGPMIARFAERCVVIAAWDRTPLGAVRAAMRSLRTRGQTETGVYVNRVPPGYRFGRLRPD